MEYFSMFSGIGGFEYGIERAYSRVARERECDSGSSGGRKEVNSERTGLPQADRNMHNPICSEATQNNPKCVGYSEIDKYAKAIYRYHYPKHKNYGNAKDIVPESLPDFDLLVGGFPCQAFSIAGKRGGFDDTRGTLFFDVARVLKAKRPEWFLLENVKGLCSHEGGKTLGTIYRVLTDLGYTVGWEVVNSCQFGVPQNRERIFIVGHLTEAGGRIGEILPVTEACEVVNGKLKYYQGDVSDTGYKSQQGRVYFKDGLMGTTIRSGGRNSKTEKHNWDYVKISKTGRPKNKQDIAACLTGGANSGGNHSDMDLLKVKAVLTPDRLEKRQNGRRFKENEEPSFMLTSQDKHGVQVGTKIRRLTPVECERLQGFPDDWTEKGIINGEEVEISDTQRYKCVGNAVTVNVIEAFMKKLIPLF